MKKFIAIFMCIALLAVCFVACGDKEEENVDNPDAAVTTAADGNGAGGETTEAPAGETEPTEDGAEMFGTDKDPYAQDRESWD